MYTDSDLNLAVKKGIFTQEAVKSFRQEMARLQASPAVDEENFRLVSSLNDIFVVIASLLFLISGGVFIDKITFPAGKFFVAIGAWGIAEFFVRKRKMALPAITLLLVFVGFIFYGVFSLFQATNIAGIVWAGAAATVASILHWYRFKVPITIAAGTAALICLVVALTIKIFPDVKQYLTFMVLVFGIGTFSFAMYWDSLDVQRVTRKSDVAFWLHLLSAPMIIHPLFVFVSTAHAENTSLSVILVVLTYVLLATLSLITDRRAFMVSALAYVIFAFNDFYEAKGLVEWVAITGAIIGASLLFLSALWNSTRKKLVTFLPEAIKTRVPATN